MRNYFSYTINYILIKSSFYTKKGPGFVPGHHPYDFWLGPRTYFLTSTMRRVNLVYSLIQKHFALHKAQNTNCQWESCVYFRRKFCPGACFLKWQTTRIWNPSFAMMIKSTTLSAEGFLCTVEPIFSVASLYKCLLIPFNLSLVLLTSKTGVV